MSSFELRALEPGDAQAVRNLRAHAFQKGRVQPPPPDDAPVEEAEKAVRNSIGVFEGGQLMSALTTRPFDVHWGESATLAMGGIAGVATFAEARGRGHVDALLRQSLENMRAAGQVISALYPFSWAFYRKFGWDWVGRQMHATLPLRELKSSPAGKLVRSYTDTPQEALRETLRSPYTRFAQGYHGVFTADSHQWEGRLRHDDDHSTYVYTYAPENSADTDSYLLWRFRRDGDAGEVREWVGSSPDSYRAFLSLLHYLATQCKTARVTLPMDSPLWSHLMHWDVQTELRPVFMGRLVDLAGALSQLGAPGVPNGTCTLAVRDECAPWNEGVWRITVEAEQVTCAPVIGGAVDTSSADVALDIQALSQAFWGTPGLAELRAAGRLEVRGEEGYTLLTRLFPSVPVYTLDFF